MLWIDFEVKYAQVYKLKEKASCFLYNGYEKYEMYFLYPFFDFKYNVCFRHSLQKKKNKCSFFVLYIFYFL